MKVRFPEGSILSVSSVIIGLIGRNHDLVMLGAGGIIAIAMIIWVSWWEGTPPS